MYPKIELFELDIAYHIDETELLRNHQYHTELAQNKWQAQESVIKCWNRFANRYKQQSLGGAFQNTDCWTKREVGESEKEEIRLNL